MSGRRDVRTVPTSMRGTRSRESVHVADRQAASVAVTLGMLRLVGELIVWLARHPVTTVIAAVLVGVCASAGPLVTAVLVVLAVVGLWCWRRWHAASFRRLVTSRWRTCVVYRRRWQPAMVTCGLASIVNGREFTPTVRRVVSSPCEDRVLVDLLSGQAPEDFEANTTALAHTFDALSCRVTVDRPGRVWLTFTHTDPLTHLIPALPPVSAPDLGALPLGRREDGQPWTVRLLGTHWLIAGATGSGKGSVLWSLIRAMGPAIRDRVVQVWAIDPKGGMELSPGSGLFTRFAYHDPESMVLLLEEAVLVMRQRTEVLRCAGVRVHVPTREQPLIVVVVDELAALTAYAGDRDLKRRAETALQLLLSQGRAPGVLVVAAVQDPSKDVVGFRDLFPARIALRLLEDVQVDMVLGRSARHRGAECDRIPPSLPGVGYVVLEGVREPVRVRAAYVTDADLPAMVAQYRPGALNPADQPVDLSGLTGEPTVDGRSRLRLATGA
jgi:DNA segregation ATPase FtsK/SpoIIIE, S-DNA-T family